jgi:HSP20 family molecular chaperone IbpA
MVIAINSELESSYPVACSKIQRMERELGSTDISKYGNFKYACKLHGFRLSEITINREQDCIVIKAKSTHNGPYEYCERSMKRIIKLPDGVDKQSVSCKLNDKGEFSIYARKTLD